jgi:hypothetical protein
MSAKHAKAIVFRYDGDVASEETEFDHNGDVQPYTVGQPVFRNGKRWRVAIVLNQTTVAGPKSLPIHRVFLEQAPDLGRR